MKISLMVGTEGIHRKIAEVLKLLDEDDLLFIIGTDQLAWVHENFRVGGAETPWKRLAPNTIASRRGGSSLPLRDTGALERSFVMDVKGKRVELKSTSPIAPFHEHGTNPYTIRPKRPNGTLAFKTTDGVRFAKEVKHPGLVQRKMLPTKRMAERLAKKSWEGVAQNIREVAGGQT